MSVKSFRRSLAVPLTALLLVLVAGPVAAARCSMPGYCPMMAKQVPAAPCSSAAGTMSAPMSCCQPEAAPASNALVVGLEAPAAIGVMAPRTPPVPALASPLAGFSRAGELHPLGLFTLHSVWRI